jgi:predicted nucleic acid-binding protein
MGVSRVFWDTNLFIYLLEDIGPQSARVAEVRERMLERDDELCTSTLTLGEVLVKPAEQGNEALRQRYEGVLSQTARLIAFDRETARRYAEIRRNRSIRPPDAIQLACAAQLGVDLFITNDDRLSRLTIPGIQFLVPLERAFF